MTAFESAHPDKWVLLVTDEVLDHLRRLTDAQLVRDLGMLRALGEFADGSRLKIMAGVQQSLFNNSRFIELYFLFLALSTEVLASSLIIAVGNSVFRIFADANMDPVWASRQSDERSIECLIQM
jgi:hypothetical protein